MPIINNALEHKQELEETLRQMLKAMEVVTKAKCDTANYVVKGYYVGNLIRIDIQRKNA